MSIAQEYNISEFLEKILKETEGFSIGNPRRISEVISIIQNESMEQILAKMSVEIVMGISEERTGD